MRFLLAQNEIHADHDGLMNENAGRVRAVVAHLQAEGLWDQCEQVTATTSMAAGTAAGEEGSHSDLLDPLRRAVLAVHTAAHLASIVDDYSTAAGDGRTCIACTLANRSADAACRVCGTAKPETAGFAIPPGKGDSVYRCPNSLQVALRNCELAIEVARRVVYGSGPAASGLVLSRPPGHHAVSKRYDSYCLINTVCVVAAWLLQRIDEEGNLQEGKVMILDWDVHHADETQAVVTAVDSPLRHRTVLCSIHRHDNNFRPTTCTVNEVPLDTHPYVVNVPLRGKGFGDADYVEVFRRVVLPLVAATAPRAILVSAGYDCARGDALGRFSVDPRGFATMTTMLLSTGVPCVFLLEGGYDVEVSRPVHKALIQGVAGTVEAALQFEDNAVVNMNYDDAELKPETAVVVREVLARAPFLRPERGPFNPELASGYAGSTKNADTYAGVLPLVIQQAFDRAKALERGRRGRCLSNMIAPDLPAALEVYEAALASLGTFSEASTNADVIRCRKNYRARADRIRATLAATDAQAAADVPALDPQRKSVRVFTYDMVRHDLCEATKVVLELEPTDDLSSLHHVMQKRMRPGSPPPLCPALLRSLSRTLKVPKAWGRKKLKGHIKEFRRSPAYTVWLDTFRAFVRNAIAPLIGESFAFQCPPTLRIQLPSRICLGHHHRDSEYPGFAGNEINFWVPLVDTLNENTLHLESAPGHGDLAPVVLRYGEFLRFDGNGLLHGTVANTTDKARVSLDFRVIPLALWQDKFGGRIGTYPAETMVVVDLAAGDNGSTREAKTSSKE